MPSTSCDPRCTYQVVFTKYVHQVNFERLFCSLVNPTLTMRMVFTACVVTSSSLRSDVSYNSVRATIIAVPHERQEVVVSWKSTFPIQQVEVASIQAARPLSPCWSSTGSRAYYGEVFTIGFRCKVSRYYSVKCTALLEPVRIVNAIALSYDCYSYI